MAEHLTLNKDTNSYIKKLRKQGWTVERGGSGHTILIAPNGNRVTCASSPKSGHRSLLCLRADVKRALSTPGPQPGETAPSDTPADGR